MAQVPVASRYAEALFSLGVEQDSLKSLGEALQEMKANFEQSAELRTVLLNPAVQLEERRKVIVAIAEKAKWPRLFQNFVQILLDKDRLRYITEIAESYAQKVDAHQGRARARVTSAVALKDEQVEQIRARLGALTGKDIIVTTDVDEDLIGGIVARVGSTIYDGSVRTHLQRMREAILKEV